MAAGLANADALDTSAAHPHQTNYAYDGFDRLVLTLYADGSGDQAAYDANGNAVTRTNRAGEIVSFAYDALNRVVSKALPVSGSIAADTVSWAYDLAGRIVSLSDTAGQALANSYDSAGRIVSTATAVPGLAAKTVSYAYDAASNRTKLTWPDGYSVSYAYDAANRMTAASDSGGASLATFDYDQLGRPAWEQYGTGTPAAKVSFSWSNEGDLLTLTHALSGTASVSYTNGYTPACAKLKLRFGEGRPAHQIASATLDNAAYRYVPQANGTDSYVPNALNQYASVTPAGGALTSIGYDLKGNLASDGAFSFAYDAENKLMTAAKTGTSAAYAYDGLGRRDEKTVNGTSTYFLSADADEIAEYDGAGTLLRRYVPGPAIDRPVAMVDAAGTRTFFHQDKTGSVIAMSDTAGNRVEGPYLYDVFGNGAPYTGVPFKYTGRRLDPETGLYYYRARYYSPAIGRFNQTDAIGYADDIDWYTYVGNDPTDKTDPTGEIAPAIVVAIDACLVNPACRGAVGFGVGAVIGATVNLAGQATREGPVDLNEVKIAAIAGGVNGALVANGVNPAAAGAVTSGVASVATDVEKGTVKDERSAVTSGIKAVVAAGSGAVGGLVGAGTTGAAESAGAGKILSEVAGATAGESAAATLTTRAEPVATSVMKGADRAVSTINRTVMCPKSAQQHGVCQ